jgi:hypothetical protein
MVAFNALLALLFSEVFVIEKGPVVQKGSEVGG